MEPTPLWEGAPWQPRRWQAEALPIILRAIESGRRPLVKAATGAGKSVALSEIVRQRLPHGRVAVCAPTTHLVTQLAGTIRARVGDQVGEVWTKAAVLDKPVTVCCAASAYKLLAAPEPPRLLIVDEAHGSEAKGIKKAIKALQPEHLVGFTATPFRGDRQRLGLFDHIAYQYRMGDGIRDGVLVPPAFIPWEGSQNTELDDACLAMIRQHGEGPGVVSAQSIADAKHYASWLTEQGIAAEPVYGTLRRDLFNARVRKLKDGELRALVHVKMLAEGVDFPWLRWICLRRKAGKDGRVRFIQEVGRVVRVFPGKSRGIVLDPLGLSDQEGIGLDFQAEFGEAPKKEPKKRTPDAVDDDLPPLPDELAERDPIYAKRLSRTRALARRLHLHCQMFGLVRVPPGFIEGEWRRRHASPRQMQRLRQAALGCWGLLPGSVREGLNVARGIALSRGEVADLIDVFSAVRRAGAFPDGFATHATHRVEVNRAAAPRAS